MSSLKNHTVYELEKAISTALTGLCGKSIGVKISAFVDKTEVVESLEQWKVPEQAEITLTVSHDGKYDHAI